MVRAVEEFTEEVDLLVSMLEQRTEARIDLLHVIQIISMVFSVLIVIALFLDLKNRVLRPLRKLVGIATAVGEQDFSQKARSEERRVGKECRARWARCEWIEKT